MKHIQRVFKPSVVISTVARPKQYILRTLRSLGDLDVQLVVGSPDDRYLSRLRGRNSIRIHTATDTEWKVFESFSVRHRASWNYWRCLTYGGISDRTRADGVIVLEDDVVAAPGWFEATAGVCQGIEDQYGGMFVLALYTSFTGLSRCASGESSFADYPPSKFFGTQAMYFPAGVGSVFCDYLASEGVVNFRMHYDLLLAEFLLRTGIPLFATRPCLFEHIGEVGTGLAPFFHRAGSFHRRRPRKEHQ